MTIDELQRLRMLVMWPAIVGSAGFLLARLLFWLMGHTHGRSYAAASAVTGGSAAVVARMISGGWDNSMGYWLAYTLGTLALAVILLMTGAQLAVEMWHDE